MCEPYCGKFLTAFGFCLAQLSGFGTEYDPSVSVRR
jgi:hypothetical protein